MRLDQNERVNTRNSIKLIEINFSFFSIQSSSFSSLDFSITLFQLVSSRHRHRPKATILLRRKIWRKLNGLLNASQTFYSDNASQRAPPLRFESSRPRRKAVMTGNRGRMRIWGGRGSGCSGVAVLCSFLGRSKLRSGTCRFHATKRLGPDFDLAETLSPRPHDPVVARQTSACLKNKFRSETTTVSGKRRMRTV